MLYEILYALYSVLFYFIHCILSIVIFALYNMHWIICIVFLSLDYINFVLCISFDTFILCSAFYAFHSTGRPKKNYSLTFLVMVLSWERNQTKYLSCPKTSVHCANFEYNKISELLQGSEIFMKRFGGSSMVNCYKMNFVWL